jgi:hypothetical protein
METPRLITPQGTTIILTPELYQAILPVITVDQPRPELSREERLAFIRKTFGKYRDGPSLTQALLKERVAERAREDSKMC